MQITFAPFDMPDTAARLIDSAVFMRMMRSLPTTKAQALINTLKKAPANFLDIQDRLLDSTADSVVLLGFSKGLRTGQSWLAPSDSYYAGGAALGQARLYPFVMWPQNPPPHPRLPLAAPVHAGTF